MEWIPPRFGRTMEGGAGGSALAIAAAVAVAMRMAVASAAAAAAAAAVATSYTMVTRFLDRRRARLHDRRERGYQKFQGILRIRTLAHNQRNDNDKQSIIDDRDGVVVTSNDRSDNDDDENRIKA